MNRHVEVLIVCIWSKPDDLQDEPILFFVSGLSRTEVGFVVVLRAGSAKWTPLTQSGGNTGRSCVNRIKSAAQSWKVDTTL